MIRPNRNGGKFIHSILQVNKYNVSVKLLLYGKNNINRNNHFTFFFILTTISVSQIYSVEYWENEYQSRQDVEEFNCVLILGNILQLMRKTEKQDCQCSDWRLFPGQLQILSRRPRQLINCDYCYNNKHNKLYVTSLLLRNPEDKLA
jgi:hypothetical protein